MGKSAKDFAGVAQAGGVFASKIRSTIDHYQRQAVPDTCSVTGKTVYILKAGSDDEIHFSRPWFSQPAAAFEKAVGISGVAQHYTLPLGIMPVETSLYVTLLSHAVRQEEITKAKEHRLLSGLIRELKKLNPDLRALRHDEKNDTSLRDIIHGVASGFCVADIQHFIDGNYLSVSLQDAGYKNSYDRVQKLSGHRIAWVPAKATLQKMEEKIIERNLARQHRAKPAKKAQIRK